MATAQQTWATRREVFEKSYDEVLEALKHQDEKLNRTLTAIAFLAAAGVTLFTRVAAHSTQKFPESTVVVADVFFVIFLIAVVFAVVLALTAIGPNATYGAFRFERSRRSSRPESLIFYASISRNRDWGEYISESADVLAKTLARNLHDEAQNLSFRVNYKVARSRESGAFVQAAIVAFALLGTFSIERLGLNVEWWIASGVLAVLLWLPLVDLVQMRLFQFTRSTPWASASLVALTAVWSTLLLLLAPSHDSHWIAIFFSLGSFLTSRLAIGRRHEVGQLLLMAPALAGLALVLAVVI